MLFFVYNDDEITLRHGDKIFMYTDGLTEAHEDTQELFGSDRMLEVLNKYGELPVTELLLDVGREVNAYTGDAPQYDDLTMLALEYK